MRLLLAVQRRVTALHLAVATSAGVVCLSAAYTALRWLTIPISIRVAAGVTVGCVAGWAAFRRGQNLRTLAAAAVAVERTRPQCRNLVITAEEILRYPERANSWIAAQVFEDAATTAADLNAGDVIPALRAAGTCAAVLAMAIAIPLVPLRSSEQKVGSFLTEGPGAQIATSGSAITVTIRPPAYTGSESSIVHNPERLDVLEGSRLTVGVSDSAPHRIRFGNQLLGEISTGRTVELVARESGYFAVEDAHARRLIAVAVAPDNVPVVRIDQPARDLLLPDSTRAIPLRLHASDDHGLQTLEVRYTKVSGTGEQFEFVEGTMPVRVDRFSAREWRGDASLTLQTLGLEPGDSLVYRAVAKDARPGSEGVSASDTYFVEIAGPGQVALEGVDMPPDEERYALSQQMIVLKIERLRVRERTLTRERVAEETANIAAEQRAVRANFVFLLGGHVEDEEVEAEQATEISEGRLQNTARRDVNAAIREMTRAEQGLVAVDTAVALPPARAAVTALQRAFGRSRYLLRALPGTGRIDPARRLSGTLTTAASWRRDLEGAPAREGAVARDLLERVASIKGDTSLDPRTVEQLAERALAVDASSPTWRNISARLLQLRTADRPDSRRAQLDAIVLELQREAERGLLPRTTLSDAASPLRRAWERQR